MSLLEGGTVCSAIGASQFAQPEDPIEGAPKLVFDSPGGALFPVDQGDRANDLMASFPARLDGHRRRTAAGSDVLDDDNIQRRAG